MGRVGLPALIILFILLGVWVAGAQSDEQEIMDSYDAIAAAFEAENISGFMYYISPEYFDECENYTDFRDDIQYFFDNYFDLELNMEIHNVTISGDMAFAIRNGNWSGKRNDNNATEWDIWFFEEDRWKKENGEWRWYGNQRRSYTVAMVGHNFNPWDDHYFLRMEAESGCEDIAITSANVSGSGIGEMAMNPEGDGFVAWATPFVPSVGDVYTFHLAYSDGYTEEVNDTIERLVESGPSITHPQHLSSINDTQPVFRWTNASSAVGNMGHYWVWVENETGDIIWEIELPLTQLSVGYNSDGTASIGLEDGHGYWLEVFVFDIYDNFAYSRIFFNVSMPVTLSGHVFDSSSTPLANVPVKLGGDSIYLNNKTDSQGRFEFVNVSKGTYDIYINENDSPRLGAYTAVVLEYQDSIDIIEDMEINVTLLRMDASLKFNASNFRNGDTIMANVTVTNNEAFDLVDWAAVIMMGFENETDDEELYFNMTPINLSAGETESHIFILNVPEDNTYPEIYVFGGAGREDWVVESSSGNLNALIYQGDVKEVSITLPLSGDVNDDCRVNIFDLAAVGLAYGSRPGDANWNQGADVRRDGVINIFDLATVGLNYGRTC